MHKSKCSNHLPCKCFYLVIFSFFLLVSYLFVIKAKVCDQECTPEAFEDCWRMLLKNPSTNIRQWGAPRVTHFYVSINSLQARLDLLLFLRHITEQQKAFHMPQRLPNFDRLGFSAKLFLNPRLHAAKLAVVLLRIGN